MPLDRVTRLDKSEPIDRSEDRSSSSSSSNPEEVNWLGAGANDDAAQSQRDLLPRRERRLWYNRWLQWFKPMDRISVGFMPVRGRKGSFIAARGKKSAIPIAVQHIQAQKLSETSGKSKVSYYLVAVKQVPSQDDQTN